MTPFARPVVPDVNRRMLMTSGSITASINERSPAAMSLLPFSSSSLKESLSSSLFSASMLMIYSMLSIPSMAFRTFFSTFPE